MTTLTHPVRICATPGAVGAACEDCASNPANGVQHALFAPTETVTPEVDPDTQVMSLACPVYRRRPGRQATVPEDIACTECVGDPPSVLLRAGEVVTEWHIVLCDCGADYQVAVDGGTARLEFEGYCLDGELEPEAGEDAA